MKRLHTLFLLLTIAIDIAAQPICQVKHFSVSDGLAQGNVMSILQDQKGLVWFSTLTGLTSLTDTLLRHIKLRKRVNMHSAVIAWELFQKANTEIYGAPLTMDKPVF